MGGDVQKGDSSELKRMQKTREYHKECLPENGRWKGQVGFRHGLCDACGKEGEIVWAVIGHDAGTFKAEVLIPEIVQEMALEEESEPPEPSMPEPPAETPPVGIPVEAELEK